MTKDEFVTTLTTGLAQPPAYFPVTAGLNKSTHAALSDVLEGSLRPLSLEAAEAALAEGGQVLDTRASDDFAAGHMPGSVNIGLDGKLASWAGTLLALDRPVVVIAEPGEERTAVLRLGRIGFDRVLGYLEGGPAALREKARVERISVSELADLLGKGAVDPAAVLDVRMPGEWETAHIEGAVHVPLGALEARVAEVPQGPVYVHCKSGYRSMTACSLLARAGRTQLIDVAGGIDAWIEAGLGRLVGEGCPA